MNLTKKYYEVMAIGDNIIVLSLVLIVLSLVLYVKSHGLLLL